MIPFKTLQKILKGKCLFVFVCGDAMATENESFMISRTLCVVTTFWVHIKKKTISI